MKNKILIAALILIAVSILYGVFYIKSYITNPKDISLIEIKMMNDKTFELSGEINNSTMKFVGYEVKKNGDDLYIRIKNRFLCREPDETKYVNRFHIQIDYSKTKDINKIYLQGKHAEEKELIWTDKRQTDKKKIK